MRVGAAWVVPVVVLLLGLLVVIWFVRLVEPRLAFFPLSGEDVTPANAGVDFTARTIDTSDGERLRLWHLPRPDARARVVYFHGNGGNLSMWSDVLVPLWQRGFEVIAVDYRGYGLSTGAPSERGLYRDVDATLEAEHAMAPAGVPLIYWGRSLGVVMAAYGASRRAPDGLILEAGFPSMRSVVAGNPVLWVLSWFSSYRFPAAEWLSAVRSPALVLHGDRDSVIPYRLGRQLHEAIAGPKTFVTIPGGDHNDAVPRDPALYWSAVDTFVASLSVGRGR